MMTFLAACWTALLLVLAPGASFGETPGELRPGELRLGQPRAEALATATRAAEALSAAPNARERATALDRETAPRHAYVRSPDAQRLSGAEPSARRLLVRGSVTSPWPERWESRAADLARATRSIRPRVRRGETRASRAHAVQAHGGLRPYFPTAPPVRS